jgi:hypothetical protein
MADTMFVSRSDQLRAFLAHDGILARKLELARNSHDLVATVGE